MKPHRFLPPLLSLAISAFIAGPAMAEPVNEREGNQQIRIGEGIEDHELSAGEVDNLEISEAKIKWQERHDRLEHGGKLTKRERARLERELNLLNRRIHRERHK